MDWRNGADPAELASKTPQQLDDADRAWARLTDEEKAHQLSAARITRRRLEDQLAAEGFTGPAALESYLQRQGVTPARPVGPGIDAADLIDEDLPPLRWIVPDLFPEGTTILAAPPKVGKSCLVYQAAVEVAIGGELLGRRVSPGSALYLALEDGRRRGRDRLVAALGGRTLPRGRLEIRWSARRIGEGLEDDIGAWLDAHPDAALVAVDTLGKVRPRGDSRRNAYELDVEHLARLQHLFRDRAVALVIVHHARKEAGDDFLASVSGTYGITGSADTIAVVRRKRLEAFGTVLVTGRDVPDAEIPVRFEGQTWRAAPAVVSNASMERTEVYRVIEAEGPIFPKAIADRTGLERTSVQHMVERLVGAGAVARTVGGYVVMEEGNLLSLPHHSNHSESDPGEWGEKGVSTPSRMTAPPPSGPSVTIECRDYLGHQDHHRRVAGAWICTACEVAA